MPRLRKLRAETAPVSVPPALTMRPSKFPDDGRPCVVLEVAAGSARLALPLDEIRLAQFKKQLDDSMSAAWRAKLTEVF